MNPSRQEAIETITLLLTQAIDALESGGPELVEPASELREMVTRPPRVAIAGRLKSGKSTLVNALTQHHIAATDSVECTMAVSMYLDGAPARAEVVGLDGRVDRVSLGQGPLDHLPRPLDEVDYVRQFVPNASLQRLSLIDTPGTATLTVDNEQRTRRMLIDGAKDTRRASAWADCVVFLSDSAPREDERVFLSQLGMTPLTTMGVLSRADSFGAGAFGPQDPIQLAGVHAARIAEQLGSAVRTVLPLSGLLAESALVGQVTERVARSAAALAHLDRDGVLDVIEVDDPSIIVPGFTAAMRDELLDVLGEYGVMVGRSVAHAQGAVGLMQWMRDVSGIDSLTDLLTGDNAYFAVLQRAVRMLDALEDLSNNYAVRDHVRWVQEILLGQPQMHEVLLYRSYRDTYVSTPDSSLLGPLRQAITAATSAEVAGLSQSADPASVHARHEQELGRLQQLAMTPLSAAEDEARERLIIAHQQALRSMT